MIEVIVYGIVLGSIIALGSVGLTLIWGITDLFNCAHGDQIIVGRTLRCCSVDCSPASARWAIRWVPFPSAGDC